MAQPRLCYAMSVDGLLPPIFTEMDSSGNLHEGTRNVTIRVSLFASTRIHRTEASELSSRFLCSQWIPIKVVFSLDSTHQAILNSFFTDSFVCTLTMFSVRVKHLRTSGRKFLLKNKDYDDRRLNRRRFQTQPEVKNNLPFKSSIAEKSGLR